MPPVFGPGVAVAEPLEVLRRQQRHARSCRRVIANSETSGPSRYSSITTRSHAAACASASSRSSVTTTPLPAASPSSLTTYGGPNASSAAAASLGGACRPGPSRSGTLGGGHHLLGERLGALEPGGLRGRAEAGDARGAYGVGDPGDQRRLRARPRPGRRRARSARSATAAPSSGSTACSVRDRGDAGVAGRGVHRRSTPGSRASAEAEACSRPPAPIDEDLHARPAVATSAGRARRRLLAARARRRRAENGAPDISSSART